MTPDCKRQSLKPGPDRARGEKDNWIARLPDREVWPGQSVLFSACAGLMQITGLQGEMCQWTWQFRASRVFRTFTSGGESCTPRHSVP